MVRDPGNVHEYYSGKHAELGGERADGMLTSPSKTYLKLSLSSQPPVEGQLPKMTVLYRVHIPDQFVGRAHPIPQNFVETVYLSLSPSYFTRKPIALFDVTVECDE